MNKSLFLGNVTKDLELRHTPNGAAVLDFSIAVNNYRKDKEGNNVNNATFVNLQAWNKKAELLAEYAVKGSKLLISDASYRVDSWDAEDENGNKQKRYRHYFVVNEFEFVGSKRQDADTNGELVEAGATEDPPF